MIIATLFVLYVAADAALVAYVVRKHGPAEAARRVRALLVTE